MMFYAKATNGKCFKVNVSPSFADRYSRGASVSIGITGVSEEFLRQHAKQMTEITYDEWNHSGCQSSCVRRGGKECRW